MSPPRSPSRRKETGDTKHVRAHPLLPPFGGRGHFKLSATRSPDRKTCFRRCRQRHAGRTDVDAASVVAVVDSVPPDRALAVTRGGRRRCKNAGTILRATPRTPRNSQAERRDARPNLRVPPLGAGPRTPLTRPLAWPVAAAVAADNAAAGRADAPGRVGWPDNAGSLASAASAAPPGDRRRCNSGSGDAPT